MKKVLLAISLVFFLSSGMLSAANYQSATTVDVNYTIVMADDDASVNAYVDGDDEKDKKKKKDKDAKCCDKKGADTKCATSSKKCCDTKKSCDKSKTSTEVKTTEDKDGK